MYLVLLKQMYGSDAKAIFKNSEDAKAFIESENLSNAEIQKEIISGEYKYPNPVYASHKYVSSKDIHEFSGLYSNYEDANEDSGKQGQVFTLRPK